MLLLVALSNYFQQYYNETDFATAKRVYSSFMLEYLSYFVSDIERLNGYYLTIE